MSPFTKFSRERMAWARLWRWGHNLLPLEKHLGLPPPVEWEACRGKRSSCSLVAPTHPKRRKHAQHSQFEQIFLPYLLMWAVEPQLYNVKHTYCFCLYGLQKEWRQFNSHVGTKLPLAFQIGSHAASQPFRRKMPTFTKINHSVNVHLQFDCEAKEESIGWWLKPRTLVQY